MENIFKLYGKNCIWILLAGMLAAGGIFLLQIEWKKYGIADDGARARFSQLVFHNEKPAIDAVSRRVLQGERVFVRELAAARDANGDDLTDRLHFQDKEGCELTGYLNTEIPGQYPVIISVRSPYTGKENRKTILILVDGRGIR